MDKIFGQVFTNSDGEEYGVIRKTKAPFPSEIAMENIIAEDECGNYFIQKNNYIYFWDHELNELIQLANSLREFKAGCDKPKEVNIEDSEVISVWVDPEFAKRHGIKPKP